MHPETSKLAREVEDLKQALKTKETQLQSIRTRCQHLWEAVKYEPIHHKGYHIPGDPPGVGGVDHQFPMDVPPRTDDQWSRTCANCGLKQVTARTKEVQTSGRVAGTRATEQVPDFPEPNRF